MKLIRKNPLFFAFLFPALMDSVLTLVGQDKSYWMYRVVNEASPVYYILKESPVLFIIGTAIWYFFWYAMFKKVSEPLKLFFMFLFIAGHTWGSSTWIWKIMRDNNFYASYNQASVMKAWSVVIIYFALIALIAAYSIRIHFRERK